MFFRLRKAIIEAATGRLGVLDSLAVRNLNMFLKQDKSYEQESREIIKEYYSCYVDYLQQRLAQESKVARVQKFINKTNPINENGVEFGSDEWERLLHKLSDDAVALIAFTDSFKIVPMVLELQYFHDFPGAEVYVKYIQKHSRKGAYYIAGLILRFHRRLGSLHNDGIAQKFIDAGQSYFKSQLAYSTEQLPVEIIAALNDARNMSLSEFNIRGYETGIAKYFEVVRTGDFPPLINKLEISLDVTEIGIR